MFSDPSIKARQLEQARKNKLIVRNMALFAVTMPVLWGAGCILDHRKMSFFSDSVDVILASNPNRLTKKELHRIMGRSGETELFKLQPSIRESLFGESGHRAIYPTSGEAFCQSSALDPGIIPQCIHVAYDKSDRVLWTYAVLVD